MVIPCGQKRVKTPWKPVVFHDNSMEYSTCSLCGVFVEFSNFCPRGIPRKIFPCNFRGRFSIVPSIVAQCVLRPQQGSHHDLFSLRTYYQVTKPGLVCMSLSSDRVNKSIAPSVRSFIYPVRYCYHNIS